MGETIVHTIDVLRAIASRHSISHVQLMCYLHQPLTLKAGARHYGWVCASDPQAMCSNIKVMKERIAKHPRWGLAFTSRVKTVSGAILHIPMIDFRAKVHLGGGASVKKSLVSVIAKAQSKKAFPGYLLISGESYHYVGLNLMTFPEWLEFLGMCLLCEDGGDPHRSSPVDRRWVGRALTRHCGSLRIFASEAKPEPYVVEFFGSRQEK